MEIRVPECLSKIREREKETRGVPSRPSLASTQQYVFECRSRSYAADDTGGRRRRRVAGHRARAVERLQPRGLRDALLPLHRRHGRSPGPQGQSSSVFPSIRRSCHACSRTPWVKSELNAALLIDHPALPWFLDDTCAEDPGPWPSREESGRKDAEAALLGHPVARLLTLLDTRPSILASLYSSTSCSCGKAD